MFLKYIKPGLLVFSIMLILNLAYFQKTFATSEYEQNFVCKVYVYPSLDPEIDKIFKQARTMEKQVGKSRNYKKISELYEKAADQGHWKAMNNLAILYLSGLAGKRNPHASLKLYKKMIRLNIPEGFIGLAELYNIGLAVPRSEEQALKLIKKAAFKGHPYAQKIWGTYLINKLEKRKEGLQFLHCAVSHGSGPSAYQLYLDYLVVHEDPEMAYHMLKKGAQLGDMDSMFLLHHIYDTGDSLTSPMNKQKKFQVDKKRASCLYSLMDKIDEKPGIKFPNLDQLCPSTIGK